MGRIGFSDPFWFSPPNARLELRNSAAPMAGLGLRSMRFYPAPTIQKFFQK